MIWILLLLAGGGIIWGARAAAWVILIGAIAYITFVALLILVYGI